MSINKIIIGFIIILLLFSGYIMYQINTTPLPKSRITIDNHSFLIEVATNSAQQQLGLSKRTTLPQNQGMLFIFKTPDRYAFWMKDMNFPLDLIFINNNKIVTIYQNVPEPKNGNTNLPIYTPDESANQVFEINAGLSKQYGFKKGDSITIDLKH
ncbi:MAG TPA: DUF192 domain-containing protein [Candidatus Sulfotelmatobacter sp.]|jgi:uncharacterized membrane protein (UPF0127 family)|nr:DUF192 domain-containing protein [Candidatus Sulfotelmatobacter sp.]